MSVGEGEVERRPIGRLIYERMVNADIISSLLLIYGIKAHSCRLGGRWASTRVVKREKFAGGRPV
jgi:hypothetical protein